MDYEAPATLKEQELLPFFLDLVGIASVAGGLQVQVASHLDATVTSFSFEPQTLDERI